MVLYEPEELLPLVIQLTDKYTSKESTSVPYETAQILMEAVIYCLNENFDTETDSVSGKLPGAEDLYKRGCRILKEKVYEAKRIYEEIIRDFEDYGNWNYKETILKGIPAFFLKYDMQFQPQNHLLTLDYPLISGNPDTCGVDLILAYLKGIAIETRLLKCFDKYTVMRLLEREFHDYKELYMDNLCYPVLHTAAKCVITGKNVGELNLLPEDDHMINTFFEGDSTDQIKQKMEHLVSMITKEIEGGKQYFQKAAADIAHRQR